MILRAFRGQLRALLVEQLRTPATVLANLLTPAIGFVFCVLFVPALTRGPQATVTIAQFWVLAALSNGLFTTAVTVAADRHSPWGRYLQTLPTPAGLRALSVLATVVLVELGAAAGVFAMALTVVARPPSAQAWAAGLGWLPLVTAPFVLLGFTLGRLQWRAVLPVAQACFLAAAFGGGLLLPATLAHRLAPALMPTTAGLDLLAAVLAGGSVPLGPLTALLGWTAALAALAVVVGRLTTVR